MRMGFVLSLVMHVAVFVAGYVGLPALQRPPPVMDVPILVEVVEVGPITNVPPPPTKPAPPAPPKPEPKVAAAPPPPAPAPPPAPEPEPEVAAVPPPPPPQPKAKAKPKPKPEPEAAPPPPKPQPPAALATVTPRRKPTPPDPFASVLKTVETLRKRPPEAPAPAKAEPPEETFGAQIAKALKAPARRFDATRPLTVTEIDLVRQQIAQCWNVPAGAKDAENLVIEIRVAMNPDGTVRSARIGDTARLQSDPFFRAAAESALRAVLNPRCQPLKLPFEKYAEWKTMTLVFNPREMFGS